MAKTALYFPIILFSCMVSISCTLSAQTTTQTSFGKNRVQYHHQFDDWSLYETPNFTTYWYGDARNVAQSALQMAEFDFLAVQQLLEHQISDKIEILVFSDLTDLKQSNIGEDDVFLLNNGETKVVGNKIFVYFDGDHRHLRAQLREGVASVLLNSMLYGANLQEIVSNAVLLNLPPWYTSGLTAYCGDEWGAEQDDRLRDLLQTGRYKTFDKLAREHPRFAGQAFWHYISTHFGPSTVSNLLYLTRINRSVDNGFFYILGSGYRRTTDAMLEYYRKRYREEARGQKAPDEDAKIPVRNRKKLPLYQLKISPDGKKIAWVSNDIGKWKVWMQALDPNTPGKPGKRKRMMKGGSRNALQATDYNYPQIAWNPDNQHLAVLYESRDVPKLASIELTTGKKEIRDFSPEFQRIFSMDYVNPNELAISAAVKGYSDLFIYRTINKQTERLTNDFWDDLDVSVATIDGRKSLLFASNRTTDTLSFQRLDTILPITTFDIYLYDLESRSAELVRVTNTPLFDERAPMGLDSIHFAYVSDECGTVNRQAGVLEPFVAYHQAVVYLKDGAEVKALDTAQPMEWPLARILTFLAPLDSVLKNIDSTQIDSIRSGPVFKKKPRVWNLTNYDRNLLSQHSAPRAGRLVERFNRGKKSGFYVKKVEAQPPALAKTTRWREQTLRSAGLPTPPQPPLEALAPNNDKTNDNKNEDIQLRPADADSLPYIEPGWLIQIPDYLAVPGPRSEAQQTPSNEPNPTQNQEIAEVIDSDSMVPTPPRRPLKRPATQFGKNGEIIRFYSFKIIPYRLHFRTDYVSTTMDNNQLFEGLQLYEGPQSRLQQPPPGVLLRANFKDLLENYVIEAGFRLPTTFNGAEYYLWMDDKKKRIDKRYVLYRRTIVNSRPRESGPGLTPDFQERTNTLMGQYELRYPIDVFTSLRATFSLREDKVRTLSSDAITLGAPDRAEQRASVRLAAVYDNSVDVDLNLKTGTRAKVYTDVVKGFALNTEPNWSLKLNNGFMTVVGFDARHYQMLDRRSQLALRFAGATSFGSEKMLYIMGGVDNWVFPKFNDNIALPSDDGFAYQAPAVNLRGFKQNVRNGNTFALMNAELRIPIFKYFIKKPVIGNFWRNFQMVGFFDAGTAWQGKSPYSFDNPINTKTLYRPAQGPFISSMKVNYFRDPIVAGYGVGLRAVIFGLYLRADYAWGIESRQVQKPLLHIALGTDF